MREYLLVCGQLVMLLLLSVSGQNVPCGAGQECVNFPSCEAFVRERAKLVGLRRGSEERRLLLQRLKSLVCHTKQRNVCCEVPGQGPADPDSPSYLPSLEDEECGVEGGNPAFVLGGQDTGIGEFPFLGLLGKRKGKGRKIEWECGGSIINKWFVLSAAHCGDGGEVELVRLGEWKVVEEECEEPEYCERPRRRGERQCGECQAVREKVDCETVKGVETCTAPYQDIAVAEIKVHPDYGFTAHTIAENDIMLLKLSRPAVYNDFVQPVCLPSPGLDQYGELGVFGNNLPTVVGWGKTTNRRGEQQTDIQQKLEMPVWDNKDCIARFKTELYVNLTGEISTSLHLCAGGELGKDSCHGDSGGPLMARRDALSPWQQVGIVSGGTSRCGIGAPAIFTRVTQYSQWIRDNLN